MIYLIRRASRQTALKDDKSVVAYVNSELFPLVNEVRNRLNDSIIALNMTPVTVTADYALAREDVVILVDATAGAVTLTLPDIATALGEAKYIMKTDSSANAVTVAADSSDTIEGAASISISTQWDSALLSTDMEDTWLEW